jgi:cell division protein FtsW
VAAKLKQSKLIPDPALVLFALIATVMGMFFIFDAGYARSIGSREGNLVPPEFRSQIVFLIPSLLAGFCCSRIKESTWLKASGWIFLAVVLMLVAVTKFGIRENGAQRWLGVGSFSIQPAEFAKVAVVLFLAAVFATRKPMPVLRKKGVAYWLDNALVPWIGRILPGLLILVVAGLIDYEKDLGTAGVIAATAFLMFLPGGVKLKSMLMAVALCMVGGYVLVKQEPYRLERIANHQTRWSRNNVDDDSFQTVQSELAMASGGIPGVGIGNGRAKQVIPATTTDFIMATIGEEFGVIGSLLVLFTLGCLVWRLLAQGARASSKFSQLILYGVGAWIGIQTCVNVSMANGFLPAIGIPLPFISSGGSSLVALWCAIGVAEAAIGTPLVKRTGVENSPITHAVVSGDSRPLQRPHVTRSPRRA